MGSLTDARLERPIAKDARLEFSHKIVSPLSLPWRHEHGWMNILFFGQAYLGPGSMYSAHTNSSVKADR